MSTVKSKPTKEPVTTILLPLPVELHRRAKAQAALMGMSWAEYGEHLIRRDVEAAEATRDGRKGT